MAHLIGYLFFVCLFLPSNEVSAWGGPVGMKVPPTCHSARSKESASSFLHRKSRFSGFWSPMDSTGVLKSDFVGRRSDLLRMTRVACSGDFQVSGNAVLGADTWTEAARQLARKILAHTGFQKAAVLTVRNMSSLRDDDLVAIRLALQAELRHLGARLTDKGPVAAEIQVTLSENAQGYLWIAEIRNRDSREVTMIPVSRLQPETVPPNPASLVIRKTRIFEQNGPILDVAILKTEPARFLVLDLDSVSIYASQGTAWRSEQTMLLVRTQPWPRDPRGRLIIRNESAFDAFAPSMKCSGTTQPALTLDCRESYEPWPLSLAESGGAASAYFTPDRNFFDGRMQPDNGASRTVPPFFSAAAMLQKEAELWAFAGTDGRTQVLQKSPEPLAIIEGWGSSVTAVKSGCGGGWQLLSTRASSFTEADAVQAYEISNHKAVAVTTPEEFAGPVTALWPTYDSSTAVAVSRDLVTGRYEAFALSISCSQ
jgi:hypothetical protein